VTRECGKKKKNNKNNDVTKKVLRVRWHDVVRSVGLTAASLCCRRRRRRSCVTDVTVVFGGGGGMVGPRAVCHSGTAPPLRHRSQRPRDLQNTNRQMDVEYH